MKLSRSLPLSAILGLAACGSSTPDPVPALNPFVGTLSISGGNAISGTNCVNTTTVTFMTSGADKQTVSLAAGDCLRFVAGDGTNYQPANNGTPACNELNAPVVIAAGTANSSFTTVPLDAPAGPRTCHWQDLNHPPSTGGGGGGGAH